LLVYVAANLPDRLGCTIEGGPTLFLSANVAEMRPAGRRYSAASMHT
jgi:hypothetical protein